MKGRIFLSVLCICVVLLGASCASTSNDETSQMRREMREQMMAVRRQMQASGASLAQLREFDKAMAEMERLMRQAEKQMRALDKQPGN